MLFLTQGKTNWKYIIIILILAVIVGGGILGWIKRQEIPPAEFPEIEKLEKVEEEMEEPYIRVVSPNGGEEWIVGNSYEIQWECSKKYSKKWSQLGIDIWLVGKHLEDSLILKIASISSKAGINQYNWLVPSTVEPGEDLFKIKIGTPDHEFEDISDECFSIAVKDETADWKTYRNEEISFKYPPNFEYRGVEGQIDFYQKGTTAATLSFFSFSPAQIPLEEWLIKTVSSFGRIITSKEVKSFGDVKDGILYVELYAEAWPSTRKQTGYVFNYRNRCYSFWNEDSETQDLFLKMLSTLRFLK